MISTSIYFVISGLVSYLMILVAAGMQMRKAIVMLYLLILIIIGAFHYRILVCDTVFLFDTSSIFTKITALLFFFITCFVNVKRLMNRNTRVNEDIK